MTECSKIMNPKLLLFDLDGTLLFTGGAGIRAMSRMFLDYYGLPDAMSGVEGRGRTDPEILVSVFKKKLKRAPKFHELKRLINVYPKYLTPEVRKSPGY